MQAGHVTPATHRDPNPDIAWLIAQHQRDTTALEQAADVIVTLRRRVARLEADQTSLILHSRRPA